MVNWKFWEGSKDAEPAPTSTPRKWVGSIKAEWASTNNSKHEYNVFNLFVDGEGKRSVEMNGANAANHPVYLSKIYPWIVGAPNEVLTDVLTTSDPSFWGDIKVATKARRAAKVLPKVKRK